VVLGSRRGDPHARNAQQRYCGVCPDSHAFRLLPDVHRLKNDNKVPGHVSREYKNQNFPAGAYTRPLFSST